MSRHLCGLVAILTLTALPAAEPSSRTVRFTYAATISGLAPDQKARIWLPVPSAGAHQDVAILEQDVPPGATLRTEPQYGNRILYVEAAGPVTLRLVARVTRRAVAGDTGKEMAEDAAALARFLKADALVPIDGKCLDLLRDRDVPGDPTRTARVLYDVVNGHMRYSKEGTGWGRGDAVWACDNGRGNCTDFHSLFIALARSRKLPAKFEIGFPLPAARGTGTIAGYHCWAFFRPDGKGWVPVDISEANKDPKRRDFFFGNLPADRVALSTGRDITLVPKQDGPPLNYFVFPYVEVGGKPWPADKVRTTVSYQDE